MKKIIITILILSLIGLIIYCNLFNKNLSSTDIFIKPITIIDLKVPEPSGLHFDNKTKTLWTVSDDNSRIYNINLEGKIISSFVVDGTDLEGITMINDSILVTILERDRIVVFLNKSGEEIRRFNINIKGKLNSGLEGIAYNSISSNFFILNEKQPGVLLEVNVDGKILNKKILNYAKDYSGLVYVQQDDELWMISDEDEVILKCKNEGTVIEEYKVNINQIEGIAIDSKNAKLYLVSDSQEKLYVFNLP